MNISDENQKNRARMSVVMSILFQNIRNGTHDEKQTMATQKKKRFQYKDEFVTQLNYSILMPYTAMLFYCCLCHQLPINLSISLPNSVVYCFRDGLSTVEYTVSCATVHQ